MNEHELNSLTKEELILKIKTLNAHNIQLKNIIAKSSASAKVEKNRKPFDFNRCSFRHILLQFYYLGWDYQGFAVQEDTINTIENYLFESLIKTCLIKSREESNYHRCGRTDKGVSSFRQVISLDIRSRLSKEDHHKIEEEIDYCSILNRVLPDDIQCLGWSPVSDNFSARFDCKSRTYKYFFPKGKLDIEKIREASKYLLGTHDFRNLCKMDVGNGVIQFIRNIVCIDVELFDQGKNDKEYDMYVITINGQAFLWHQIRCIVGILFLIGEGKESPEIIKDLLDVESNPRKPDYSMASEIPLNLYDCNYEHEEIVWQYNSTSLSNVLNKLRRNWTFCSIRGSMMKSMITDIELKISTAGGNCSASMTNFLLQGVRTKVYVPVMKRPKCDSLEDKIKHYAKRNRIEISDD